MADFRPATAVELKALRALNITQQLNRRALVRRDLRMAQVRLARILKPLRPMQRVSDLLWHAQVTQHEASALATLARLARRLKIYASELHLQRQRLTRGEDR